VEAVKKKKLTLLMKRKKRFPFSKNGKVNECPLEIKRNRGLSSAAENYLDSSKRVECIFKTQQQP